MSTEATRCCYREEMTVDDARSAVELIADDLATYFDDSLVKVFLDGFQEFLDSPARVRGSHAIP